jgi:hypothetical protein
VGKQKIIKWISMEELTPPKNWTLPFEANYQGKKYQITGADLIDRYWRAEEYDGNIIQASEI